MTKQEAIINVSTIMNRKSSLDEETDFFSNKKHDDLLELFLRYIENSSPLIGNPKVIKTQALNDHGVDLIIHYPNTCKIGVQLKSHFDVKGDDFSVKVKVQFAESQYHGLDKWYLLICSPLAEPQGKKSYSSKISHLMNEFSSYKTSYHVVYTPQQMVNIFKAGVMQENEFRSIKNQYYFEETNWVELLKELDFGRKKKSYLWNVSAGGKKANCADLYNQYLHLTAVDEKQSSIDDLRDLLILLQGLSKQSREFLCVCVEYGDILTTGMFDRIAVLCHDIENRLDITSTIIRREVAILENKSIAYIDDIEGEGVNYSIVIKHTNPNYNILATVKEFCNEYKIDLQAVIVDMDFSHFD